MSAFLILLGAVLVVLTAIGIHDLQAWLERWDHNRRLCD
jgi:multisubunit Na+/H+ antiporter MnhG subunit